MARIAGVNLPTNKRAVIALQYIHGVGQKTAREIMEKLNLHSINEMVRFALRNGLID